MNDNFIHGVTTEKKPWTHLNFGDRGGMDFSFGIISDRTGRATPGVFEGAIEKFNRMRPDFVISVGDFIEGGCMEDFSAPFLQKQWDYIKPEIEKSVQPFFYVAGNHDYSPPGSKSQNRDLWNSLFGVSYYYFIYKDTLFICLNSSYAASGLGEEQLQWALEVIKKNVDVRWTFVFLHKPACWLEEEFSQIEEALYERNYTVISGDKHTYTKYVRNGRKYFMLGTSGGEFQYLGTWQRKYADYSPAMQSYFREFLTKRYGSDAKLQKAWNNSAVTLKTAKIPTGKERKAAELGMFRDLDKARNVADFIDCLSDAMVSGAMEFLQVLREEAPNKLAGLYGGYVYYYSGYQLLNSAHANFGKLYRSRLADFISSPHDYIQRKVGWPGGHHGPVVGTSLYNLSWWDENDTRTIMCAPGGHRHVDSMHETIGVLKRDLILQITKGVGNTFYDLAGGWFDHPAIMEALRKTNQIGKFALTVPGFKRGQAAVLYCTDSIKRLAENNNGITVPLRQDMRRNLGWSGITVDQYLLEDILQDNFPEYDCYILPNVYAPSDKLRKAIKEKLLKKGKLVIFGYAPGAFRENSGKIDLGAMKELTGISFGLANDKIVRQVSSKYGKFGNAVKYSPGFFVNDKTANTLGTFANSKLTAVADKKVNGANVVVTMVPELNAAMYRDIFRKNGMHIFCESEDPVYYDGRFIAIHANTSGEKVLTLPEAREWFDLFRNKAVSGKSKTLKLKMERGQTEIFFIGSKADAERYKKM